MTGQQVKLMMDKDFPESPLSTKVVLDSPQGQNLDQQIQDHEHQNSNSQNPILDQNECSDLDLNRPEVPRGEKDPGLASGQDADCPDPPGAQNQILQLDLDHGEENCDFSVYSFKLLMVFGGHMFVMALPVEE